MSEFRIEKRRAEAALTLATGLTVRGCFFLSGSSASRTGPERVADLLNAEPGFFPFELHDGESPQTVLYNRAQLLFVALLEEPVESQLESDYSIAKERAVRIQLSDGSSLAPLWCTLAVGIAWSRVHVGVHHASDVLGGLAIGTAIGLAARHVAPLPTGM